MEDKKYHVPVLAEINPAEPVEYLFWVGCLGAFDERFKKATRAFVKILNHCKVSFAVLGKEETCCGDPARRSGNEMTFQMQSLSIIEMLKAYQVNKIVTMCPHCFNTFKNEYPDLGGSFHTIHYTHLLSDLIGSGKLNVNIEEENKTNLTFHDPCYLGRANNEYKAPREVIAALGSKLTEMPRNKSFALCCGAGGGQMFKEAESGDKEIFIERTEEAIATGADIIATACPYCMVMITDGLKYKNKEEEIRNLDLAELIVRNLKL